MPRFTSSIAIACVLLAACSQSPQDRENSTVTSNDAVYEPSVASHVIVPHICTSSVFEFRKESKNIFEELTFGGTMILCLMRMLSSTIPTTSPPVT